MQFEMAFYWLRKTRSNTPSEVPGQGPSGDRFGFITAGPLKVKYFQHEFYRLQFDSHHVDYLF